MPEFPADVRCSEKHEWARDEGNGRIRVGITDFAQNELGDIYFVDLPEVGREVGVGDVLGDLEASKSHEEIYAPVSGKVVEVNEALIEEPEKVNSDPFGEGWIALLDASDAGDYEALMDAEAYRAFVQ
ncbi:MAG: glycine cleavage system protein GcvH [Acidobacteria bacterium]|nr:MAG: glycine cleavage system protein GcvH [Acidobacteriota bacterium]